MKKNLTKLMAAAMAAMMLAGCSSGSTSATAAAPADTKAETTAADTAAETEGEAKDSYTIGIGQFAEHGSLDNCREGFLEGLAQEGIKEGENLTVLYENSQADGGTASQIIDNFMAKKVDLICAIATPMAQSAYSAAKKENVPVIYTAVTDPILAELANEDGTPVGEITGTSDKLPVEKQLEMIRALLPDAKKIGIMYSTSEINSASAIEEYKAAAGNYGFEIVESGISATADIPLAADNLLEKVDCLNNLTDNTVVSSLPLILDKAAKKNIPVFGSEIEQVKAGCVAAMGIDYFELGKNTGAMAAKILKGEATAKDTEYIKTADSALYVNTEAADKIGMELDKDYIADAAETFTEITVE